MLHDVLCESILAASGNFLFKDCFGPEWSHKGHKVRDSTYSSAQQRDTLRVRSQDFHSEPTIQLCHNIRRLSSTSKRLQPPIFQFSLQRCFNHFRSLASQDFFPIMLPGLHQFHEHWKKRTAKCGQFIGTFQKLFLVVKPTAVLLIDLCVVLVEINTQYIPKVGPKREHAPF